jgi:hypothetical protein
LPFRSIGKHPLFSGTNRGMKSHVPNIGGLESNHLTSPVWSNTSSTKQSFAAHFTVFQMAPIHKENTLRLSASMNNTPKFVVENRSSWRDTLAV